QPAGRSYQELLQRMAPMWVPIERIVWVCVRVQASALALAFGDDSDPAGQAPQVVVELIRRVRNALQRNGRPTQIPDRDALLESLCRSCDLVPSDPDMPAGRIREQWRSWQSARLSHRTFWIDHLPVDGPAGPAVHRLTVAPASL